MTGTAGADVVVLGSMNLDIVVELPQLPGPGQTCLGRDHREECGGKGANQAVAAARAGARVAMVGAVGDDDAGRRLLSALAEAGVDVEGVRRDAARTGVALIMVDDRGENMIAVSPGANAAVGPDDADRAARLLRPAGILLCQLEVPVATVADAARRARVVGARVALNPSPPPSTAHDRAVLDVLLGDVDVLVVNESEAVALAGLASGGEGTDWAARAARALLRRGAGAVVVTLGGRGSVVLGAGAEEPAHVRAFPARAVDAVGAGDSYLGALVCELARGRPLPEAARVGAAAAALAVSRPGAQAAIPRREEIEELLGRG